MCFLLSLKLLVVGLDSSSSCFFTREYILFICLLLSSSLQRTLLSILFVELCELKPTFSVRIGVDDGVEDESAEDFGVLFVSILVS